MLYTSSRDMGLLERLSGEAVTSLIHHRIKQHVDHKCKGNFEVQYIDSLEQVSGENNRILLVIYLIRAINESDYRLSGGGVWSKIKVSFSLIIQSILKRNSSEYYTT